MSLHSSLPGDISVFVVTIAFTRAPHAYFGAKAELGMDDPRDDAGPQEVVLTDSSDDELADLEKEYAVKRQKLLERKRAKNIGVLRAGGAAEYENGIEMTKKTKGEATRLEKGMKETKEEEEEETRLLEIGWVDGIHGGKTQVVARHGQLEGSDVQIAGEHLQNARVKSHGAERVMKHAKRDGQVSADHMKRHSNPHFAGDVKHASTNAQTPEGGDLQLRCNDAQDTETQGRILAGKIHYSESTLQHATMQTHRSHPSDAPNRNTQRLAHKFGRVQPSATSSSSASAFAAALENSGHTAADRASALATRQFEFVDIPAPLNLDAADSDRDEVSGMRLRKRYIEAKSLRRLVEDKKLLRVEKLLAKVCPPGYNEPAYANWCFVGMILERLDPIAVKEKEKKAAHQGNDNNENQTSATGSNQKQSGSRGKYLKLSVGSFSHSVRVMLFGAAMQRWWKLRVGDVVCILNPTVSRWSHQRKTGFTLALNTAVDAVLEIGQARDVGTCSYDTGAAAPCTTVIDTSQGPFCSFHQDLHFRKYASSRMELNGSVLARRPHDRSDDSNRKRLARPAPTPYAQTNEHTTTYAAMPGIDRSQYTDPQLAARDAARRAQAARIAGFAKRGSLRRGPLTEQDAHVQPFTSATLTNIGYDPVPRPKTQVGGRVLRLLREVTSQVKTRLLGRAPRPAAAAAATATVTNAAPAIDYSSDSSLEIE